jgi:DNA mismatch repair ATPase MutS
MLSAMSLKNLKHLSKKSKRPSFRSTVSNKNSTAQLLDALEPHIGAIQELAQEVAQLDCLGEFQ